MCSNNCEMPSGLSLPRKTCSWINFDMALMGWLGHKTSTQTNKQTQLSEWSTRFFFPSWLSNQKLKNTAWHFICFPSWNRYIPKVAVCIIWQQIKNTEVKNSQMMFFIWLDSNFDLGSHRHFLRIKAHIYKSLVLIFCAFCLSFCLFSLANTLFLIDSYFSFTLTMSESETVLKELHKLQWLLTEFVSLA